MSLSGRKTFSSVLSSVKSKLDFTAKLSFKPLTSEIVLKSINNGSFGKAVFFVIVLWRLKFVEAVVPAFEPSIAKAVTPKFRSYAYGGLLSELTEEPWVCTAKVGSIYKLKLPPSSAANPSSKSNTKTEPELFLAPTILPPTLSLNTKSSLVGNPDINTVTVSLPWGVISKGISIKLELSWSVLVKFARSCELSLATVVVSLKVTSGAFATSKILYLISPEVAP